MSDKVLLIVVVSSLLASVFAANSREAPSLKFTSAKCTSSNSSGTYKCYVKAYSRKNTTLNVILNQTQDITEANVHFEIKYRSLTNQWRLLVNVTFDFCDAMKNRNNPLMNWLLNLWSENFRNNLHACPYKKGTLTFTNLYMQLGQLQSRFAGGHYMVVMHFFNSEDRNILTAIFTCEFITIDREAF